ncbi:MAG: tRNA-dihydrouridine synthase family protein, partial [Lachnospiraceae bacterium]|nr:tRNA-dihydrouridine synthase family protein [Lachnospiraceae bacterium]
MKLYLAPLEGVTSYILRNAIAHHYGGFDRYFTPFITSATMNHREREDVNVAHNADIDLVPQIMSNNVEEFLDIAASIAKRGYETVNLNLGCPSKTVVGKKRGSGFLSVPDELDAFLAEIYDRCPVNISIKTRLGMDDLSKWPEIVDIYKKYPMEELIIHPRIQREFYKGTPHIDEFIYACKQLQATQVPVCYNGDIVDINSYKNLLEVLRENDLENVTSVMIGRGAMTLPMIARDIRRYGQENESENMVDATLNNASIALNSACESFATYDLNSVSDRFLSNDNEVKMFWIFHNEIL